MRRLTIVTMAMTGAMYAAGAAQAAEVNGVWLRDSGASQVRFAPCGGAVCGHIIWIKPGTDTPAKIGQRIFYDMKSNGADSWSGKAFNPEDGKTYSGKMSVSGSTLTTAGCALAGLICKSTSWSRVK